MAYITRVTSGFVIQQVFNVLLTCYPFLLNTRTVSGVKITKIIQLIFVKGKEKSILKILVHLYMINWKQKRDYTMNKFVLGKIKVPHKGMTTCKVKEKQESSIFKLKWILRLLQILKPKSKKDLTIFVLFATVVSLKTENYGDVNAVQFSFVMSYDGHSYICRACDKTMKKNFIPWQAVCNKMGITFLPKEFESISRLERVLVSRRILFKKVVIMPKGKLPKIKGSLCNIPVNEVYDNCKSLPRPADSNGLLIVKFKCKAEYHTHVLFEPVRPLFVESLLKFLKHHNHIYSAIQINMENLPSNVLDFNNNELNNNGASNNKGSSSNSSNNCSSGTSSIFWELLRCHYEPINVTLETAEEQDVLDYPLAKFKTAPDKTTVISEIPSATDIEEVFIVTPDEEKKPRTLLGD